MASNAFKKALANTTETKDVEKLLSGSNYLGEGTHEVTVQSVDTSELNDKDRVKFTFVAEDGKTFNHMIFVLDRNKEEFSYGLRSLWAAAIPDTEALQAFLELASEDDKAFEVFTGMQLQIKLERGTGYVAKATGNKTFAAYWHEPGAEGHDEKLTDEFEQIKDADDAAKARDIKKAYLRVVNSEATHAESNVTALYSNIESRKQAKAGGGSAGQAKSGGAAGVAPQV